MHEAFLIHVGSAQEAIKKKGYFKAYEENCEACEKLRGEIKSAKAALAKFDESASGEAGTSKKSKKTQKNGNEKSDFRATKKCAKKTNPTKQSFVQLSKKLDKLEKAIKEQDAIKKKCRLSDTDSDSE
jgi:hypothetical protein